MDEEKVQQTEQGKFSWNAADQAVLHERQMQLIVGLAEPTRRLIEAAGIREGFHVLDLTAGTGGQSIPAARAAGSTGTVLATDISSAMLKRVELFAEREGLTNVKTQVMDAQQLLLADQTFDAVITRFGLNFLDYHKAFSESLRVLKPGRRMAALIWSTSERHPFSSIPMKIIQKYVTVPSVPDELANPGVFEQAIKQAGFSEVSVQSMPIHLQIHSLAAYFELFFSPPSQIFAVLASLSQEGRQHVLDEVRQALLPFQRADGTFVFPSEVLLGVGTRKG